MNRVTAYISKYSLDQRIDAHPINDVEISSKKHDFSKLRKQLGRYKAEILPSDRNNGMAQYKTADQYPG